MTTPSGLRSKVGAADGFNAQVWIIRREKLKIFRFFFARFSDGKGQRLPFN
jgi:hypothetical protein